MPPVTISPIAHIFSDFPTKFGVPRQSGLVPELEARIIFEPEYRRAEALRGLEEFSYIWLIWHFSQSARERWSPTVRPPRLGGNARVGVFASRSPFRPNPLGLSSVRLERIELSAEYGPVLHVSGADLMDGTPIFDIKPYVPYSDSHPASAGGFTDSVDFPTLDVCFPEALLALVPPEKRAALSGVLARDPRPPYQDDPARVYGFVFAGMEIKFAVAEGKLRVISVGEIEARL